MRVTTSAVCFLLISLYVFAVEAIFEGLNRWIEEVNEKDNLVSHGDSLTFHVDLSGAKGLPERGDIRLKIYNIRNNNTLCDSRLFDHVHSGNSSYQCQFHESDAGLVNGANTFELMVYSNDSDQIFTRESIPAVHHLDHTIADGYFFYNETERDQYFGVIIATSLASYGMLRWYPSLFVQIGTDVLRRVQKMQESFGPFIGSFINSDMQKDIVKFLLVHNPLVDIFTHPIEHLGKLKRAVGSLGDRLKGIARKIKGGGRRGEEPAPGSLVTSTSSTHDDYGNKGGGGKPGKGFQSQHQQPPPGGLFRPRRSAATIATTTSSSHGKASLYGRGLQGVGTAAAAAAALWAVSPAGPVGQSSAAGYERKVDKQLTFKSDGDDAKKKYPANGGSRRVLGVKCPFLEVRSKIISAKDKDERAK